MAIKGAFTFAEMVLRLTRGYIKATGQQPDNLAKIKINMEAAEKVKQQNKVINVDFNPNEKWWKAGKKKLRGDESFDELLDLGKKGILDDDVPFNQGGLARILDI